MSDSVDANAQPAHYLEIVPTKGWEGLRLRELLAYRELLYFLTLREIKVRYKQTAIGASWALSSCGSSSPCCYTSASPSTPAVGGRR